ncbi:efflux RND transporter periplasmic adaptor subunit [Methylomonas sp. EFPC1]|uniref:efflux RND transporter periplasmic adaptor subunit n=1 Tax=unclassified Methylomonas TaxID=2608980 RepID=UPI00051B0D95|nr:MULTISPECIES: efflux RND transporter periplasmic adaptor subunit [unclassified Methylomonas]QBC28867.1 efflux RND transporter periplasmic adaptor subunit [Methylomonas sp. LW13]QSB00468.1 efflux RND transporter periplasmic adaptor subunit [Methylomonas sp. EFPC1]
MTKGKIGVLFAALLLLIGIGVAIGRVSQPAPSSEAPAANPALSVSAIRPQTHDIPLSLTANGSIAAWQEAVIGAEIGDLRLSAVNVQIGEAVKKGQVLATFSDESVLADVAQARGVVAEAEANLAEARLNAERARKVSVSGALSAQQVDQYLTGAKTAEAKLQSAKAQLDAQLLRLKYTKVLASDDGVISARSATLGAVATKGQELFRLIRQNRLEWRGELTAAEMTQLKPGNKVRVEVPNVGSIDGEVRFLAPTLDVQNRNGLVYVDLPRAAQTGLRAGMFARGEFELGSSAALTVPQEALSLRDGFSYVFLLTEQTEDRARVKQVKVQLGRRNGDQVEILAGVAAEDRLVAGGASFLADGDSVRVVTQ